MIDRQGRIAPMRRYQLSGSWLQQTAVAAMDEPHEAARHRSRRCWRSPLALAAAAAADAAARASLTDIENDVMCVACHEPLAVAQSPQADAERNYIRR